MLLGRRSPPTAPRRSTSRRAAATTRERMLLRAGVGIHREGRHITVVNADELVLERVVVPATSAPPRTSIAAGVLVPGSRLLLQDVGRQLDAYRLPAHPRRMRGIVLGDLEGESGELLAEEPVSDLDVATGRSRARPSSRRRCRSAIDELPSWPCSAASPRARRSCAAPQELRLKESDRIATVVEGLRGLGADIEATEDGFAVRGPGGLQGRDDRRRTATTAWR